MQRSLIGSPALAFFFTPILLILAILSITGITPTLPHQVDWIWKLNFIIGVLLPTAISVLVVLYNDWQKMFVTIIISPYYWLLHPIACVRAFIQLIRNPHYWEKTQHGLTKLKE